MVFNLPLLLLALSATIPLPNSLESALSIRTAYDNTQPFDFEVSAIIEWTNLEIEMASERENGERYFNYSMVGGGDFIGDWDIEYSSHRKDVSGIDRQGLRVLRRRDVLTVGGGIVSTHYRTPVEPVLELRMGSYSRGLALTTDFSDVHIWRVSIKHVFGQGNILPFIRGHLISDDGDKYYRIKGGVKWVL
jgi:hypothetical protein